MRNAISTIFAQQVLGGRLSLAITSGQKVNFNSGFKLELVTTCGLRFVVKVL